MSPSKLEIIKTWYANRNKTILFTLPLALSRRYNLDEPSYVILDPKEDGILVRKLEIKGE